MIFISKEIDKCEDWENLAELTFKKRYPDGASKDFIFQKQKMFLTNKGFTFYQIESVLDSTWYYLILMSYQVL